MTPFREHVKNTGFKTRVEYKKYAGIVTSIATEAFRAMEKFLECHCGILVESLPKPDIRILYSILLNFRDHSRNVIKIEEYFDNYSLFLRAAYDKAPEGAEVEALSVYRTYQSIMKLLMIRAKEVDPTRYDEREKISVFRQDKERMFCRKVQEAYSINQRAASVKSFKSDPLEMNQNGEDEDEEACGASKDGPETGDRESCFSQVSQQMVKSWDVESEDELASFFVELQDVGKIRQRYRQVYGCNTMFENMNILRSYIYKIIRKSLRRAQKIVRVYAAHFDSQVGQVISLRQDEKYVQYVLTSPEFLQARMLLCTLHNTKQKNFELIEQIARALIMGLNTRRDMGPRMRRY